MSWYKTSIETLRQNIYIQYSMKGDGKKQWKIQLWWWHSQIYCKTEKKHGNGSWISLNTLLDKILLLNSYQKKKKKKWAVYVNMF